MGSPSIFSVYIFFILLRSPLTLFSLQQLASWMSKLDFLKADYAVLLLPVRTCLHSKTRVDVELVTYGY